VAIKENFQGTSSQVVGTVKAPGPNGNQYIFITAENRYVRLGEFVYYNLPDESQPAPLQVLGKLSGHELIAHLPDRLFADTEIRPEAIAALMGFTYTQPFPLP